MSRAIQTADLDWQQVDGIDVPISKQFGDVYFPKTMVYSKLAMFLNGNDLSERLSKSHRFEYFVLVKQALAQGSNILTLWQLWQQVRPNNHSHFMPFQLKNFRCLKNGSDSVHSMSGLNSNRSPKN